MGLFLVQWGEGECGGGLVRERKRSGWRLKRGLYNDKGKKDMVGCVGTCYLFQITLAATEWGRIP